MNELFKSWAKRKHFDEMAYAYKEGDTIKLPTEEQQKSDVRELNMFIVEMAAKGATEQELDRAIKYSIVLIDCIKKNLDVNKAFDELNILELYFKYYSNVDRAGNDADTDSIMRATE